MNLINIRAISGGAEAPEGLGNEGVEASVRPDRARSDLDLLLWQSQSALYDLCKALESLPVTSTQMDDIDALLRQAKRAHNLAGERIQ